MNILVCFKITADLEALSQEDWVADSDLQVDLRFAPQELGCFDESALSFGLKLAEDARAEGEIVKLTAVTLGRRNPSRWMKTLYALGYDECIFCPVQCDSLFSPENTANILAGIATEYGADIILTGERSSPGGSTFTAPLLSEMLGMPCYGGISALSYQAGVLKVEALSGDSIIKRVLPSLAVLSVGNAPSTRLKIPTLKEKMAVSNKNTTILPEKVVPGEQDKILLSMTAVDRSRTCSKIAADSPREAAEKIVGYMLGLEDMP